MFSWEYVNVDGLCATKSEGAELIVRAISFRDFQPIGLFWFMIRIIFYSHHQSSQTDRQTDRQTDDMRSQYRALHYSASRG